MTYVQIKQKYQVTIPAAIRKKLELHEGDTLEAIERNGLIVLIPQNLANRLCEKKKPSLLSLAGKNEGSGLYNSVADIDACIADLRAEWQ